MSTVARPLTYEDLEQLPDDGKRYEILDGRLIELTSPSVAHQRVLRRLLRWLDHFVTEHDLGEVFSAPLDVRLAPHNIVQPDLVFVSYASFGVVQDRPIEGAPDLLVEILSPSTRERDQGQKLEIYARHGVREYWTVDTDNQTLTVFALVDHGYEAVTQDDGIARSAVLPGLTIDLAALFAGGR